MIKVSAPGRAGIVGNPSGLYGGSVISCSLRERAQCVLDNSWPGPGVAVHVSGEKLSIVATSDLSLRGDDFDAARAVLSAFEIVPETTKPFSLDLTTHIPRCAGLAGSTAMIATVVGAVLSHVGLRLNLYEIAELIGKIEYDVLGMVCDFQDQYMCVFGGLNYLDFRGKTSDASQDPAAPFATVEPLEPYVDGLLPVLVAHTASGISSADCQTSLRGRWLAAEPAIVDAYAEAARLARLTKKAMLAGRWEAVGALMSQSDERVRAAAGSWDAEERLINAAMDSGAYGAKLAGAGGGSIVVVSPDLARTAEYLKKSGSDAILYPAPSAGLTVEILV